MPLFPFWGTTTYLQPNTFPLSCAWIVLLHIVSIGEDIVTVPIKAAVASAPLVKTLQELLGGGIYLKKTLDSENICVNPESL